MHYELFVELMESRLQEELGENYIVKRIMLPKNNKPAYISLAVIQKEQKENGIGMAINPESIYRAYQAGRSFQDCLQYVTDRILSGGKGVMKYSDIAEEMCSLEQVRERIFPMLVSREWNQDGLDELPHRPFLNLEIIYYILFEMGDELGSTKITNTLAESWGMPEEALYSLAMENLEKAGSRLASYEEVLGIEGILPAEEKGRMYVLSNPNNYRGAAEILSEKVLKQCADKLKRSFYLLPSSIHEMMVVPDKAEYTAEDLRDMVVQINRDEVMPEERLCDEVFYFDLEKNTLQIAGKE